MKHQDQKSTEIVAARTTETPEERQNKSCATQSYQAPQVFPVGKAKRLMAGGLYGLCYDWSGWWYYC